MDEREHVELRKLEKEGRCIIGVDRPTARNFFMTTGVSEIEAETGYAPYFEKGVVFLFFLGGPIALIGSLVVAPLALGWPAMQTSQGQ
jgi:hypothetical protein